jgi:hypothetical protein
MELYVRPEEVHDIFLKLLAWDMKNCDSSPAIFFLLLCANNICSATGCVEVVGCLRSEELVCWEHVPESVCSLTRLFPFLCSSSILPAMHFI